MEQGLLYPSSGSFNPRTHKGCDCNDPVYMDLLKQKGVIDKQLKERESFLKSLSNRTTIVDDETGEVATVIPPVKMSSQGYTITFSK